VVICNFGWFGSDVVRHRTSKENDAKVITIFHGADLSRDVRDERENVYDQLLREGDLHLPINSNWFEWLEAHGAPPEKLALHHLGVDPDDFPYSARRDKPDTQPFVFTNVCRMVEKKGLAFALKGLAELRRLEPNRKFHFRMAGDGPLLEELQQLTRTLDLSDVVTFLGRIPHSAINQELSDADAFLAPSVVAKDGDMEGIPIAIMEAMAVGLPVVSTFHSGIPELITHNVNGRLCREHDVTGLAELMREVMTEPEITRQYALEARRTIESKFNSRVSNARLESFVQAIAHGEAILPQNPSMRQAG
ncbi:MAG: glycosyltransferase, partial [Pseudomonadota bacterium]